ncbi:Serine peptidase, Clan SC, Family S09X [Angomonas deanei]|uniref:Alpha/beta hydrolase fold/Serine aminopeptidase, S33/BAAT / Acyl-CoA thioester hydrolase C terminal, putative n=1 Tax=Angomonas deanei TaxID=59799 RepID=S9WD09_9TRYP|nr:Serine peptidase, Clan SC, Family S09X [Angomonas deanei]EPY41555.1 Serine peptidase, Clan SC, Family S09X [Angomonas deanei]CAD2216629.1 alpha/beta hydrolase fold/Serine aminopeptidase, S33/BAAT / Acyl-CoA thioester hydrolase C terminal, putative [Angomonas deanei]|eukprot:EPY33970.1 Serine peptidase, Clan SC, Family S09X [Angomonas deanei]
MPSLFSAKEDGRKNSSAVQPTMENSRFPFILYFHGNAGNVGHRIDIANMLVTELECAVMMVDYRGYGGSSSMEPTQTGLERDAQACLDYIWDDPRVPHDRIYVMGTSLGGAVSIYLSSQKENWPKIRGTIVENTFTSISAMTSALGTPLIHKTFTRCGCVVNCCFKFYIKPLVLQLSWNSIGRVSNIAGPILFISAKNDELIPQSQMMELFERAFKHNKQGAVRSFAEFTEGSHNDVCQATGYCEKIKAFMEEVENGGDAGEASGVV